MPHGDEETQQTTIDIELPDEKMDTKLKEYEDLKEKLKDSLLAKRNLEDEFDRIQQQIYDKETEYLAGSVGAPTSNSKGTPSSSAAAAASHSIGNIIKGFDGFSKSSHHHHHHHHESNFNSGNNNVSFSNQDRIFSLSSALFVKQQQERPKYNNSNTASNNNAKEPLSNINTNGNASSSSLNENGPQQVNSTSQSN
ncbi:Eaf6p NDAI_0E04650 [Naumovozyma dairenensis CBS 421]|uniref:Chromatin modification-related protein EAF6 n=1 Tax=Naumovozyma dairenensis (strain ATCC 10597 / BCRC 20456 / CBS 421 / NBRC 0211 / NRRL Y-12639) TaxID=1071378 RepID=G0WC12_NAUDC|nr:hypothetical protein NDAI_0E04650 [Naumovozyma dairenensis CBS 421]CCD25282.1 hypothetical protein NDAI_0E04650 [Naumovozyma dairenensis CBS 421]